MTKVRCDECGAEHVAEPAHVTEAQGQIYAVVCTADRLTDYYTAQRIEPGRPAGAPPTADEIGLTR